ncbi:TrlF family AAA-like ATPase [Candidatus Omnitrophota bacterium]
MDKGAHYFRCDFQVHSPRDLNWNGQGAVTPAERKAYSEELIIDCRQKGLDAIAITDHHDFVFFPYVRKASQDELGGQGDLIPVERRIIVFPGIEVTLTAPNCQALLILDADFPENLLQSVLVALAITPNRAEDAKHAPIRRIPQNVVNDLTHLYKILDQYGHLKGRFIVLPNVKESGYGTILRSGFANFYKSMPCVGGYTDGVLPQPGTGAYSIIEGKNREYGFKTIGVFQTSDNRKRNHEDIGTYSTWVKWAIPTAEAIRQACLAKESRISQEEPVLPATYVTSIDISNSKFMGPIYFDLNRQYNALIGGRGTGKSTILEYLRWGVCDQLPDPTGSFDLPEYQIRRKKLIEKTLLPFEAIVQMSFIKNNVKHIVKRKAGTPELFLKIGDGEFEQCKESDVRNILPIQAYSQKQLSGVGVSVEELKRLIYSPIRQSLDESGAKFSELSSDLRNCFELRKKKKQVQKEISKSELELKSLKEQVDSLKERLKGISEEDRKVISIHSHYEEIDGVVEGWKSELLIVKDALDSFKSHIQVLPSELAKTLSLPDGESDVIRKIDRKINDIFAGINDQSSVLGNLLKADDNAQVEFAQMVKKWEVINETHKKEYEEAKDKSSSHEVTIKQIKQLEDRISEINKYLREKRQDILKSGDPDENFVNLKQQWCGLHKNRGDLLEEQCKQLSNLSIGVLKASLKRGKGVESLEQALKNVLAGTKIRKDKIEALCAKVANVVEPVLEWTKFLDELEELADFIVDEDLPEALPSASRLLGAGFHPSDIAKISEKLAPEDWINLFLVELGDIPEFEYRVREGEYIDFADASAGQQATALMYVLLNQEGPPLVIDQPEDDLDNEMVSQIARLIWDSKKKRQLIFASHNANIVVNGDAELVACCRYKIAEDQSKGQVEKQGAIDMPEIRDEITKIMEGGEDAFKLRKEKYGF